MTMTHISIALTKHCWVHLLDRVPVGQPAPQGAEGRPPLAAQLLAMGLAMGYLHTTLSQPCCELSYHTSYDLSYYHTSYELSFYMIHAMTYHLI
jgi:hypothetical protein